MELKSYPEAGAPLTAVVSTETARAVFRSAEDARQLLELPGDIGPAAARYLEWLQTLTPAEIRSKTWLSARGTRNPVLETLRDSWDSGDNWGSAIGDLFALCDVMVDLDVDIPEEWEFSQSMGGSDTDNYAYQDILAEVKCMKLTERAHVLTHAGWILQRLTRLYEAAGMSY